MRLERAQDTLWVSRAVIVATVLVGTAIIAWSAGMLSVWGLGTGSAGYIDVHVYVDGSRRLLAGQSIYDHEPGKLPYTYPPFSAWVFTPLVAVGSAWVGPMITLMSGAAITRVLWILLPRDTPVARVLIVCAVAVTMHAYDSTLQFGQVNVILLWAVVEDMLGAGRHSRFRGVGLGIAAAIKLTPMMFVLVFLFSRYRGYAVRGLAWAAAATVVAAISRPSDSWLYWTKLVVDPSRVGGPEYVYNQSLNGMLWRLLGDGGSPVLWFILASAGGICAIIVTRSASVIDDRLLALGVTAVSMLLASPVSWSHHWVWALPVFTYLVGRAAAGRGGVALAIVGVPVLLTNLGYLPKGRSREYSMEPYMVVLHSSYVLWGILVVAFLLTAAVRRFGLRELLPRRWRLPARLR